MSTNYTNMVNVKKRESEEKKILAIDTIRHKLKCNEKITIVELTKETGLSRSFFYKNAKVKSELDKALIAQQGKILHSKRDKTLNEALKETIRLQNEEITKLRQEKNQLIFALKRIEQEKQDEADLAFIDSL